MRYRLLNSDPYKFISPKTFGANTLVFVLINNVGPWYENFIKENLFSLDVEVILRFPLYRLHHVNNFIWFKCDNRFYS